MNIILPYGRGVTGVDIPPENLLGIIRPLAFEREGTGEQLVARSLACPAGSPTLEQLVEQKKPQRVVIVVNDITRPTPYKTMLPPLLSCLEESGVKPQAISLVIATGIHRPNSPQENEQVFGPEITGRYTLVNHDCDAGLSYVGTLSNGMELRVNRLVAEADLLITTGVVTLHYFAGYSGGRKSILPGVASRENITANHQMMSDARSCSGNYEDNPVHAIMLEAARLVGVDFTMNVVTAEKEEIIYCSAGDLYRSWLQAVKFFAAHHVIRLPEPADLVIAAAGGYPRDLNMYQAQKALDAAVQAVKTGGTIILVAHCGEGLGEPAFERWLAEARCPEDILERFDRDFELGGHKAYAICRILPRARVIMVSEMDRELVERLFFEPAAGIEEALALALPGGEWGAVRALVMPDAPRLAVKITPGGNENARDMG